jgi:hypothetical protein
MTRPRIVCSRMKSSSWLQVVSLLLLLLRLAGAAALADTVPNPLRVAKVWSGHPVGFSLLTRSNHQYVAYYDEHRQLTVASRQLSETTWVFTQLPERVGWDSHNYVTMAMDATGHLHLSGNIHASPLVYFRSQKPLDATSLERVGSMIGSEETRTTYPVFMDGPEGRLVFSYRSGASGNGNQFYNVYDAASQTWRRLLDRPLLDGVGQKSAYLHGPTAGPDGWLHLCWVWRETPACETSHQVCYARSRDWVHWETSAGKPLRLPITFQTGEVVDPVPINGGVINGNVKLGFDAQRRPIVSYHKFDTNGFTQVYNARLENGQWRLHQATDWKYRWEFKGGGSIDFEVQVGAVSAQPDGSLTQRLRHSQYGSQTIRLNPNTLAPLGKVSPKPSQPSGAGKVEPGFPGLRVQWRAGIGERGPKGGQYSLRWETLPPNRDQPRTTSLPPPSWLTVWETTPDSERP